MSNETGTANAVVIQREFDAPAGVVWRMWTEPDLFREWYGPDGAAVSVAMMDVRPGGTRRVSMEMQTPAGPARMWFTGEHREVVENERLVYTESMSDEHGNVLPPSAMGMPADHPTTTTVMVELRDVGGRTSMILTHSGVPADSPGAIGWAMAFDKLASRVLAAR